MLKIDNHILEARVQRVCEDLRRLHLDALVLYANGSTLGNQSFMHPYLRYLCNFDGQNTPAMLIIDRSRAPILLTGNKANMRAHVAEKSLWFSDVRHVRPPEFGEHAVAALTRGEHAPLRLAYLGYNETPAPVWKALETGLPRATWVHDFAPNIDRHRVRKSSAEIGFHRRAAEVCDQTFETLASSIGTAKRGYQLKAAMEYTARDAGCDYCDTWLTVSEKADFFRYKMDECLRIPQSGDQLLAGVLLTYDGHWGHSVRTGSVGHATGEHRSLFGICREMYEAALERLRPGEDLCQVNHAMDAVLHRHYSEDQVRRSRSGHGLGYAYEDPIVSRAFPNPWDPKQEGNPAAIEAQPGMLLELHPHLFVPEVGGAMIGDTVLVTETGYEMLTVYPRDLIIW